MYGIQPLRAFAIPRGGSKMNLVSKVGQMFKGGYARMVALFTIAFVAVGAASAQTAADWGDISGAQTTVNMLLGIGVAVTIGFVIFKLSKRGANKL